MDGGESRREEGGCGCCECVLGVQDRRGCSSGVALWCTYRSSSAWKEGEGWGGGWEGMEEQADCLGVGARGPATLTATWGGNTLGGANNAPGKGMP